MRSELLCGSEARCLREDEALILKRIKRAMIRAMHDVKFTEEKISQELMDLLGLEETLDRLAIPNEV